MTGSEVLNGLVDHAEEMVKESGPRDEFRSEAGVHLRLHRIPSTVLLRVSEKMVKPKPPRRFLEDKEMWIENEADPVYQEEVEKYLIEQGELSFRIYLGVGTELITVPAGMLGPHDDWDAQYSDPEIFGEYTLSFAEKGTKTRYIEWLRHYALGDNESNNLIKAVQRYSGVVLQEDVLAAAESFRDSERRRTAAGGDAS